jgi:polar amino acid transport system substrate-binding protein
MKLKILITLLVFGTLLNANESFSDTLWVSTEEWVNATNKDGSGLYLEVLNEIFEKHDIKVITLFSSYIGAKRKFIIGQSDCLLGVYEDELEYAYYSKTAFDFDNIAVWFERSRFKWEGFKTLTDKNAAYLEGYELHKYIDVPFNYREVKTIENGFQLLNNQQIDFFIDDNVEKEFYSSVRFNDSRYEVYELNVIPIHFVFSYNDKGKKFKSIFDNGLDELINNGRLKELMQKYGDYFTYKFD